MRKRYPLNLLCVVSLLFEFATFFNLSAEAGIVTDRFPLQMYAESQINTYNNIGDARRAGWADGGTDLIRVTSINNGWLRVSHPGSGGRTVNRWCKASELFADPGYSNRGVNVKGAQTVYRTSTSGTKFGSVSNNESVIVLAEKNNRAQILYRLDNGTGYKAGWVPLSAVQSARNVPGSTSNPIVQPATRPAGDSYATINGDYYLVPDANSGFALDVAGGGQAPEQTILQLYQKNNTDAQIFHIQPVSGQWHIIQHKRTGLVANVQWGNANSGTGLWLYHHDNTASCHWRFIKQNNGSYLIQSQLNGNPIMELQNNSVYAGGRIQLWARHTGQAGRWKLVPVGQENTGASATAYIPQGNFDTLASNGDHQIRVQGWALDRDDVNKQLEVHVYVGGGTGSGAESYAIRANKYRPDVNQAFPGVGDYHGFDETITVKRTGNQPVYVYAINIGGGRDNPELGHKTVAIKGGSDDSKIQDFISNPSYKHGAISTNCYSYAAAYTQYVYGISDPRNGVPFDSPNDIRKGDVIHVNENWNDYSKATGQQHWLVVLERHSNGTLETIEGNWQTNGVKQRVYRGNRYYIKNGKLYHSVSNMEFRNWDKGYHFQ